MHFTAIIFLRESEREREGKEKRANKRRRVNKKRALEKNIAENVTNKLKLEEIKKDLREANKKFTDAERCLDDLKIEIDNNQHALDDKD